MNDRHLREIVEIVGVISIVAALLLVAWEIRQANHMTATEIELRPSPNPYTKSASATRATTRAMTTRSQGPTDVDTTPREYGGFDAQADVAHLDKDNATNFLSKNNTMTAPIGSDWRIGPR